MPKPLHQRSCTCHHTEEERSLTGTWCSPELQKAVECGDQIQKIYEVWHFNDRCEGLFREYVNTWLKIKQEASGWPAWCVDEETKQQYIEDYYEAEGIRLDYQNIVHNTGLRSLAKLMLNNMWGKFGQKLNKTQVITFNVPVEMHEFLDTDRIEVTNISVATEDMIEIFYKYKDEDMPVSPNLNVFVAAFTTCWATLHLYEALELLQERVFYFDTDSVFYLEDSSKPEEPQP